MSMKADWYVLPGEFVAASGTVTRGGSSREIRVLQNRIIMANDGYSLVEVYSMKNITNVILRWSDGVWRISLYFSDGSGSTNVDLGLGTNWDWAHQLFYHIQCRL